MSAEDKLAKTVFINNLDSFHGRNISKNFAKTPIGASQHEVEGELEETLSIITDDLETFKEGCWNVIGTAKEDSQTQNTKKDFQWTKNVLTNCTRFELYENIFECDVIVYDISLDPTQIDEAIWVLSELSSDIERFDKSKIFILLSNVMTWAKTKPLDPEDPELPFTDEDYRRRKAHPNYKENITAEKNTIKIGKTTKGKLLTYVVNAGLCYGEEEEIFHNLFKAAWHNEKYLEIYGSGENVVPTIHIKDLSLILINIADHKPKNKYLVAVDESNCTMEDIVRAVSKTLSNGQIKKINKEDALLLKNIQQSDFDQLLVNCRIDASYINENMQIRWHCDTGLVENIEKVVKEYKTSRCLLPIRIYVNGPPASGKTCIISKLCENYGIHHIKIGEVIKTSIEDLKRSAARLDSADNEEDPDEDGRAQEDSELLESVISNMDDNNGRLDDSYVIQFLRKKLKTAECQNQGFILDGYPKTVNQAKILFEPDDNDGDEEAVGKPGNENYDETTIPQYVVCLDSTDEFIRERIMNLPETVVYNTHNTETGFSRRLQWYRQNNTDDETIINYFDEMEIHPTRYDVSSDSSENNQGIIEKIIKMVGKPRNYGPSLEELERMRLIELEKIRINKMENDAEIERLEYSTQEKRMKNQLEWSQLLKQVRDEEYQLLEQKSLPMRNYLMKNVMPTLLDAMRSCCEIRPDDPVDYVAEYLFRNNPEADD